MLNKYLYLSVKKMKQQILNYTAVYLFLVLIEYTNLYFYVRCQIGITEIFDDYDLLREMFDGFEFTTGYNKEPDRESNPTLTTDPVEQLLYEHYDEDKFVNEEVKMVRYVVSIEKLDNIFHHACFGVSISSGKILTTAQCVSVGYENTCKPIEVNSNIRVVSNIMRFLEPEDNEIHNIESIVTHPKCKFDNQLKLWLTDFAFISLKSNEYLSTNPMAIYPFPIYSYDQETLRERYRTLGDCKTFGFVNYIDHSKTMVLPIKGPKNLQSVKLTVEKETLCELKFCMLSSVCKQKLPQFKNSICTSLKFINIEDAATPNSLCTVTPPFLQSKIKKTTSCLTLVNVWINDSGAPLICDGKVWGLLTTHPHSLFVPNFFTLIDASVPFLSSAVQKYNCRTILCLVLSLLMSIIIL